MAGICLCCNHIHNAGRAGRILEETGIEGGLIVHMGCRDGKLTTALLAGDGYMVHGLASREQHVRKAREYIRKKGKYGKATVELWEKRYLPYTDQLVNLIIAEEPLGISEKELMRVLVPEGVLYMKENGRWKKITRPLFRGTDEWTHFLHGPDNNAVAQDSLIGPLRYLQWSAFPQWTRSHDHMASMTGMVSSGGRVFAIMDNGPVAFVAMPAKWELVARDAYNGILLWKREISPWEHHLRAFRSGPPELPRRMVAIDDILYVTLGYNEPLSALDAATGEVLKTYGGTTGTMEILYEDSILYLLTGERKSLEPVDHEHPKAYPVTPRSRTKRLLAVHAANERILWEKADESTREIMPTTLCLQDSRLFYENPEEIVCLDASSGNCLWTSERSTGYRRWGWSVPTLVIQDGILYAADREASREETGVSREVEWIPSAGGGDSPPGRLIAFSAANGKKLWEIPCQEGYNSPVDIFLAGDLLWTGNIVRARQDHGFVNGRDPVSGAIVKTRLPDQDFYNIGMSHHRCYRNKATDKYLLTGRAGIELIDVITGDVIPHHWIRGTCQYGIMPCNGMIYVPPHSCACYIRAKLTGLNALRSELEAIPVNFENDDPLVTGPAYGKVTEISEDDAVKDAWPTYRHDAGRSGKTASHLPDRLRPGWRTVLGSQLSAPVVAGNKVFVASSAEHAVYAVDRYTGNKIWQFTAGGRVDSPPAYHKGRVIFGSADGRVYCLNAEDGELAWHFRAAERDRRIISFDGLESSMPVHGNVLVENDRIYFAAGRSSFLDKGIFLYVLDPETGKIITSKVLNDRDPDTGHQPARLAQGFQMDGALPDILSSDGHSIFMRHKRFTKDLEELDPDVAHLYSSIGFLDDSWWHRSYWIYAGQMGEGWGGWSKMGRKVPSGRLLVRDADVIYGFGRSQYGLHGSHVGLDASITHGFRADSDLPETGYRLFCTTPSAEQDSWILTWNSKAPILVRAMIMTAGKLFIAGIPHDLTSEQWEEAINGKGEGILCLISQSTGDLAESYRIAAPPVWDGMAAAYGSLYMSLADGSVICLSGESKLP